MSFVGTKQINNPDELNKLLTKISDENSYYFLRFPHKVSGIVKKIPSEFPGIEGQMFNQDLELRWKKNLKGYQILVLSDSDSIPQSISDFKPVGKTWETKRRNIVAYRKKELETWEAKRTYITPYITAEIETRFPRKFKVELDDNLNIAQRYFMDSQTATVHFIALTIVVKNQND
ncbi:hypothetical protein [Hydrocoleum sp. CS-953]|uniref:hypothetical protein n=1 Tax=Microcoleaceae TaxID=1892252 RepID=UPI000B9BF23D|nr:hypothetical protein [Hydrocoleum sp. CS-953]OZH51982.1 hypothetical protein AFK68_27340 [Hydrocoleum sp. CS-953]